MSDTATQRQYLATVILDTRNYTEAVETLIEKVKDAFSSLGFEVTKVDNLGQKEFIRTPDRHFQAGIYVQYSLSGPAEATTQIHEKFRLDKQVNRILLQSKD
ncbi:30S ribosomal protein S6 [Ruficoccus sp. ZRK36]|uniref:30S ribosomal protein S6 n=1 Tax=Ruficoccus sp. ZRK36 TaxID=2866311 RepID=UPI001C72EC42|nr:30S ribosomal protein S6 [Ruficoccus sp. ZRK36]QYY35255.1 30S ribosomal protein S6 [Ruficoccus sp. ZRK36]